jgi:hypothetical protein
MFYPKNVPNIERALRILLGAAMISFVIIDQGMSPVVAIVLIGSALFAVVTGFVGWCPACAMLGRKLKSTQHAE